MTVAITVRTAMACDDVRIEEGGKLIAIGIINPVLGVGDRRSAIGRPSLRLHFLLSLDVLEAGEHRLMFRLRGLQSARGQTVKLGVVFTSAAKQIPFPIGPLILPLAEEEHGFKLQQQVGERWRTVATWRFEETEDETDD